MKREAVISPDGKYRWLLTRRWNWNKPTLRWIMLNPSLADGKYDTPTIERVIQVSKILGYGGCIVVNLYAWRSPSPKELKRIPRTVAIGEKNNIVLDRVGKAARANNAPVMVAWGSAATPGRVREVIENYFMGVEFMCLGMTNKGHPLHPRAQIIPLKPDQLKSWVQPWHLSDLKVS